MTARAGQSLLEAEAHPRPCTSHLSQIHSLQSNCPALTNVAFTSLTSTNAKGSAIAIKNCGCATTITSCEFSSAQAHIGPAVYMEYSEATISSSTFSSNTAATAGGAIYATLSTLTITDSTFSSNTYAPASLCLPNAPCAVHCHATIRSRHRL